MVIVDWLVIDVLSITGQQSPITNESIVKDREINNGRCTPA
jgi:hypothetical protein